MARVAYSHPLTADHAAEVAELLREGKSVEVGQVHYSADNGTLWGCDPYGCDFIVCELDGAVAERVLATSAAHNDRLTPHPAEYSY